MMRNLLATLLVAAAFFSVGAWFTARPEVYADLDLAVAANWLRGDWPASGAIHKFGFNGDVDNVEESIWDVNDLGGPARCFGVMGTTAGAIYISSDDATDAGLGVTVEALDSTWAATTISATLGAANATSGTVLGTQIGSETLLRINRAYATADALTGNIYMHTDSDSDTGDNGVPDSPSTQIVAAITAGENQTLQACYTVPLGYDALAASWSASNLSNGGSSDPMIIRWRLSVAGAASRNQSMFTLADNSAYGTTILPMILLPEKSDMEITSTSDGAASSQAASGTFGVLLVPNTL